MDGSTVGVVADALGNVLVEGRDVGFRAPLVEIRGFAALVSPIGAAHPGRSAPYRVSRYVRQP